MLKLMDEIKQQEHDLLNEIAQDSMVTQASLAKCFETALQCLLLLFEALQKFRGISFQDASEFDFPPVVKNYRTLFGSY